MEPIETSQKARRSTKQTIFTGLWKGEEQLLMGASTRRTVKKPDIYSASTKRTAARSRHDDDDDDNEDDDDQEDNSDNNDEQDEEQDSAGSDDDNNNNNNNEDEDNEDDDEEEEEEYDEEEEEEAPSKSRRGGSTRTVVASSKAIDQKQQKKKGRPPKQQTKVTAKPPPPPPSKGRLKPAPSAAKRGRPPKKIVSESEESEEDNDDDVDEVQEDDDESEHEKVHEDVDAEDQEDGEEADEEEEFDEEEEDEDNDTDGTDLRDMEIEDRLNLEFTIEKVIDQRTITKEDGTEVEEVYVKWRDLAYIHCTWVESSRLLNTTKSAKARLQRWQSLQDNDDSEYTRLRSKAEDAYKQFMKIEKILDKKDNGDNGVEYFIKWRGLSYVNCTWENDEDIDDDAAVAAYDDFINMPAQSQLAIRPRPAPSDWKEVKESPDFFKKGRQLRPYQIQGLNWLTYCWHHKRNSILGDEMGLGKTVQSVSIIETLRKRHGIRGPFLCVAPLTTIQHWRREFESWTDQRVVVYHDHGQARPIIRDYEFYYTDKKGKPTNVTKFHTLITTYEMVISDRSFLSKIHWRYLVIDEAHRLKNKSCKLTTELRTYKYDHLLLLTGTPLQNNTQELWSLLNFMDPAHFTSLDSFLADYGDLKEAEQVASLQEVLKPYILRRMKENVEKSIAPKEETIVEVELTTVQKKYYRAIYERNFTFLRKGGKNSGPSLLNIMMELRKCCNHPYLIKGVEDSETSMLKKNSDDVYLKLIQASGKLVLIDKLLPKLKQGNHKVLIFSQMVAVLDILDDYLTFRGYLHERIDGGVKGDERQAAIDRFSAPDSDRFVFLLCTRAGGIGINLTAADTVIIFDSDWNPQNDLQAQARCHRIGQDKMVKVYRLVTRNTYERIMFDRASKKLGLDRAVLTKMTTTNTSSTTATTKEEVPDKDTIDSLLKYGVYAIKDDDNASEKFYEEDIDKILDRSVVVKQESVVDPLVSNFSTASFCSSSSVPHIDVNDPNFWDKLQPELETINEYDILPRKRKNVQRFGRDDVEISSDEEQQSEEDLEEDEDKDTSSSGGWTHRERGNFKSALYVFGSGRWALIKAMANLDRWTVDQVRQYGEAFLSKALGISMAKDSEDSKESKSPFKPYNALVDHLEPAVFELYNKVPPPADMEVDSSTTTTTTTTSSSATNQFINDPSLNDTKFKEYLTRNSKKIENKLSNMAELAKMLRVGYDKVVELIGEMSDTPNDWWRFKEDHDLLIGTYRSGFGEYDQIRQDKLLCYHKYKFTTADSSTAAAAAVADSTPMDTTSSCGGGEASTPITRVWPSAKILSHRLKRILRTLDIYKKKRQKDKKDKKKRDKEKKRVEKRQTDYKADWTKRERSDFYKNIVIYGLIEMGEGEEHSWDLIKEKASLKKKSSDLIERYYKGLMAKCQEYLNAPNKDNAEDDLELTPSQCKRLLGRIHFLKKLRNTLGTDRDNIPALLEHVPSPSCFPSWYQKNVHDLALVEGVSKHGYGQFEEICRDESLPFYSIYKTLLQQKGLNDDDNDNNDDPAIAEKRKRKENVVEVLNMPRDKFLNSRVELVVEYINNQRTKAQSLHSNLSQTLSSFVTRNSPTCVPLRSSYSGSNHHNGQGLHRFNGLHDSQGAMSSSTSALSMSGNSHKTSRSSTSTFTSTPSLAKNKNQKSILDFLLHDDKDGDLEFDSDDDEQLFRRVAKRSKKRHGFSPASISNALKSLDDNELIAPIHDSDDESFQDHKLLQRAYLKSSKGSTGGYHSGSSSNTTGAIRSSNNNITPGSAAHNAKDSITSYFDKVQQTDMFTPVKKSHTNINNFYNAIPNNNNGHHLHQFGTTTTAGNVNGTVGGLIGVIMEDSDLQMPNQQATPPNFKLDNRIVNILNEANEDYSMDYNNFFTTK
ncbi:hypothetical protein SAMD00019534_019050 [Acytostelium subglobosum LB1]|uniref:hypothetical protein n=1 Tax=Acytostelium subglobosum LB1 TaxID=1410327 RepID=UPI000644B892|nr:hypothetical protein SAMD00019534_019050 [Acytostelium subglobosum LB1]GAM18730.1 hypothetical protein SAMD00019534_019050 [Acytostelium subglobosum LB1]|eukprot:XP_012757950.1 hypothetical protein SAMD00019534_019050 [Acytostelium subglobosum LB1]